VNNFTPARILADFSGAIERTYGNGQIVVYDGDTPEHIMFIKKGAVKFFDIDADGNEKILHISGVGGVFPLFYTFEDKDHVNDFYETVGRTELILVPLKEFREKLRASPEYTFQLLQWYAAQMDHIVLRLKSLEKSTSKQKILQALYYLSDQHATQSKTSHWYRINFPVTQQTLANLTGLTRETVNVTLKDKELLKVVRKSGTHFEIDHAKITKMLE
jgi:CRP/FNR family transcriptional regulator